MARYYELRDDLKTGDLLLFSGKSGFSNLIKTFTRGKWSHIGMVYRMKDRTGDDTLLIWESTIITGDKLKDIESGKRTNGVQTLVLSERIEETLADGYDLAFRRLSQPLTDPMLTALDKTRHKLSGKPYETHLIEFLKAAWDGWLGQNHENLAALFCSELIAEAYQDMGILNPGKASNEYTPKDFSDENKKLKLTAPYKLSAEIKIDGF